MSQGIEASYLGDEQQAVWCADATDCDALAETQRSCGPLAVLDLRLGCFAAWS